MASVHAAKMRATSPDRQVTASLLWRSALRSGSDAPRGRQLLLLICVHGAKHLWDQLKWICDVAYLTDRRPDLDWAGLLAAAAGSGTSRMLSLGLTVAHELLGAELHPRVLRHARSDRMAQRMAAQLIRRLFDRARTPLGAGALRSLYVRMRERRADRVRLRLEPALALVRAVFVPNARDRTLVRLPRTLSFVYFAIRPIRLSVQYGPGYVLRAFGRARSLAGRARG